MSDPTTPFSLRNPNRPIQVGVILLNSVTELLDIAPVELLTSLSKEALAPMSENLFTAAHKAAALDLEAHWITETGAPAKLSSGMTVVATHSFATAPPLDIVVMGAVLFEYTPSSAELDYLRTAHEHCTAFITVCGGMQAPLWAGLLDGKTATAPAPWLATLEKEAPNTTWVKRRWCRDGKVWTTGTLLNGLDAMRAFATEVWGGREGGLVERVLEVGHWPLRDVEYGPGEA